MHARPEPRPGLPETSAGSALASRLAVVDALPALPTSAAARSRTAGTSWRQLAGRAALGASLLLVLAAGAMFRFAALTAHDLSIDEARALSIATLPWSDIPRAAARLTGDPPGYFLAAHGWLALLGGTPLDLRAFSAMCGVLTIAVVFWVGLRLVNAGVGLLAASLTATSPILITWSQLAQPALLLVLLGSLQALVLVGVVRHPGQRWRWALWTACGVAALYVHETALALCALLAVIGWLALRDSVMDKLCLVGSTLIALVAFAPWALTRMSLGAAPVRAWPASPSAFTLQSTLVQFAAWGAPYPLELLLAAPVVGFAILGFVVLMRARLVLGAGILLVWLATVPVSLYLASFAADLYDMGLVLVSLPALLLLVAAGTGAVAHRARVDLRAALRGHPRLPMRRWLTSALSGAVLAMTVSALLLLNLSLTAHYFAAYRTEPWRTLARTIAAQQQTNDVILLANPYGYVRPAFDYYYLAALAGGQDPLPRQSVPPDGDMTATSSLSNLTTEQAVEQLQRLLAGHGRVWVVVCEDSAATWAWSLTKLMPPEFQLASQTRYPSDEATLWLSLWTSRVSVSATGP